MSNAPIEPPAKVKTYRRRPLTRYLLIGLGSLCAALGLAGMFLPLLPTVPFLLLAAACFSRSSARMQAWLFNHRLLGPVLRNYLERKGMTRRQLWGSIASIWFGMGIAIYLAPVLAVKLLLAGIGLAVSVHLARLPRLHD
ncbi:MULTISPECIES: YbaN family protein [Ferrimonas]|uniref:YbaN family protein n=1 Tax=Ferrimonas TaxID=44011 RepID=UPI00041F4DA1|nr:MULTISPECIES: YbaN family protein [Ferrimonas]USD37961.1 YbaN family protein [Ferrimonas sp. SCSIO 43195]